MVCGLLAEQLVAERRDRGQASCLATVWGELLAALQPPPGCDSTG